MTAGNTTGWLEGAGYELEVLSWDYDTQVTQLCVGPGNEDGGAQPGQQARRRLGFFRGLS